MELSDQRRDVLCPKRRDAKEWDANDGTTSDAPRMMDARNYPVCPCSPYRASVLSSTVTTRENAVVGGLRVSGAPWTAVPPLPAFLTDGIWAQRAANDAEPSWECLGRGRRGHFQVFSFLTASRML